jgi:hypothetical protein
VIGLISLPVLRVSFRFAGVEEAQRYAFMKPLAPTVSRLPCCLLRHWSMPTSAPATPDRYASTTLFT